MDRKQINEWSKVNSKFDFNEKFVKQNMKKENRDYKHLLRIGVTFGLCLLVLLNITPNVVSAMKSSPFFNDVIEWFGLASYEQAIENEYIQRVNLIKEENGVTLKVHDLAIDKQNLYMHYTVDFGKVEYTGYELNIKSDEHTVLKTEHLGNEPIDEEIIFCSQLNGLDIDIFNVELVYNQNILSMNVPVDQSMIAEAQVQVLNQKFNVNSQEFVVEKVEFYPLATHIYVKVDENNEFDVVNFDFDVLIDGTKMDGYGATWNYTKDGIVYVETSPYFESGRKEIILNSVQLQPRKNELGINLQAETIGGYTDHVELIDFLSKDKGDELTSRFTRIVPDYVDYIVLLETKETTNHKLGSITADSGVDPSFGDTYGNMIEIQIDKEALDNIWTTTVQLNFGEAIEVNKKLKLR